MVDASVEKKLAEAATKLPPPPAPPVAVESPRVEGTIEKLREALELLEV